MKLAIIPGYNVLVPQGKLVGGTLQEDAAVQPPRRDRLRHQPTAASARRMSRRPARSSAIADQPGMTVGCVNPARPGSSDWVPLDSYWYARSTLPVPGGPISWSSEGPPPTPYLRTEGLVSAKCVNDGQRGYLSIRTNHKPGEKWTDRIGGEVGMLGMFLPGWGMHLVRRGRGAGRPDPRRSARSALDPEQLLDAKVERLASLIASVADGVNTPFSTVFTVLRVTPTRSASSAWVEAELGAPFLQPVGQPLRHRVGAPFENAPAEQRRSDAERHDDVHRLPPGHGIEHGQDIDARLRVPMANRNPQRIASLRLARRILIVDEIAHFLRLEPKALVASAQAGARDRTSHALIFAFSAETCGAPDIWEKKVACCDRKMTASAGSIRALRLLRYSAFSARHRLIAMRHFAIAATRIRPPSRPIPQNSNSFPAPCNLWVTCNLGVTTESSGVYVASQRSLRQAGWREIRSTRPIAAASWAMSTASRSASISRTPTQPASSITPII